MYMCLLIVSVAMCGSLVLELQAESVSWSPRNLGPVQVVEEIGKLSKKYLPLTDRDQEASRNARNYAEMLRPHMKTGYGVIPPLDPYFELKCPFEIEDGELQAYMKYANLIVVGAKEYHVAELEVRLDTKRLDFVLEIPVLKSNVDYFGNVIVDGIYNAVIGHVNVSLNKLVIKGALTFTSSPADADVDDQKLTIVAAKYNVSSANVQYNARQLKMDSQDEQHHKSPSQGTSSEVIKVVAQVVAEQLAHKSALAIIKLLNNGLSHYTTGEILEMLLPDSKLKL